MFLSGHKCPVSYCHDVRQAIAGRQKGSILTAMPADAHDEAKGMGCMWVWLTGWATAVCAPCHTSVQ